MIVFGLILVLLALGAGVVLFLATQSLTTPVDLEVAGYTWGMTPLALLITGAAAMLLLFLGLGMIRGSVKRQRRPAREAKDAERQAKLEESIRADERASAEETHQGALAERDRVQDEELQARLAERDRERDRELASREEEFAAREQAAVQRTRANEDRVRADERSKVEQELAGRTAAVGAATASATDTADGDPLSEGHSSDAETDRLASGGPGDLRSDEPYGTSSGTGKGTGTDSPYSTEPPTATAPANEADPTDAAGSADNGEAAVGESADEDSTRPVYRTVADKIMGRDPVDRG